MSLFAKETPRDLDGTQETDAKRKWDVNATFKLGVECRDLRQLFFEPHRGQRR